VSETQALADTLLHVRAEHGTAVILVEHDLDMVAQVVDRVIVLDFGQEIAAGTLDEVMTDPVVRKAYLGKTA
jgi:ABC-type branched-subunit amino acid transport system ATPase component